MWRQFDVKFSIIDPESSAVLIHPQSALMPDKFAAAAKALQRDIDALRAECDAVASCLSLPVSVNGGVSGEDLPADSVDFIQSQTQLVD